MDTQAEKNLIVAALRVHSCCGNAPMPGEPRNPDSCFPIQGEHEATAEPCRTKWTMAADIEEGRLAVTVSNGCDDHYTDEACLLAEQVCALEGRTEALVEENALLREVAKAAHVARDIPNTTMLQELRDALNKLEAAGVML